MTSKRPLPYDAQTEAAIIGDCLGLPEHVGELARQLDPLDFHDLRAREAFAVITDGHRNGRSVDPTALVAGLRARGIDDPGWLADALAAGSGAWQAHADALEAHRLRREIIAAAADATAEARDYAHEPGDVLGRLAGRVRTIEADVGTVTPEGLWSLDDFADRPDSEAAPWVIRGLLRRDWRAVIVGAEGGGKSVLFRQLAVMAAQGRHPLWPDSESIPPIPTLTMDCENPADGITGSLRGLGRIGRGGSAHVWHRPGGIDLRSRSDRRALEAVLSTTRPALVVAGPVYKMCRRAPGEGHEDAAIDTQLVLDDLRARYRFALVLEHHAPQANNGERAWRPYGSSLWLRWPELGIAMVPKSSPDGRRRVTLRRWRGDRMLNEWPSELVEGDPSAPWVSASAPKPRPSSNGDRQLALVPGAG